MKYRKLPIVIEAVEWKGNNEKEMYCFLEGADKHVETEGRSFRIDFCNGTFAIGDLIIKTLEGEMKANIGDFVIKGINGEYYPCKPDIFKKTYIEDEQ